MTNGQGKKDLIVLVADKNMEYALNGLLQRFVELNIQINILHEIKVHPERDPGCVNEGHDFLRLFLNQFKYAILMLDFEGCGREHRQSRDDIEEELEEKLSANGWGDHATVIVIDPELETWVWADSPEIDFVLGWRRGNEDLHQWMRNKEYISSRALKPDHPKEVMQEVLRITKKRRSSSLYLQLAQRVDFSGCVDPAFLKLRDTLARWFPG